MEMEVFFLTTRKKRAGFYGLLSFFPVLCFQNKTPTKTLLGMREGSQMTGCSFLYHSPNKPNKTDVILPPGVLFYRFSHS